MEKTEMSMISLIPPKSMSVRTEKGHCSTKTSSELKFSILLAYGITTIKRSESVPKRKAYCTESVLKAAGSLIDPKRTEKAYCNVKRTVPGLMNLSQE